MIIRHRAVTGYSPPQARQQSILHRPEKNESPLVDKMDGIPLKIQPQPGLPAKCLGPVVTEYFLVKFRHGSGGLEDMGDDVGTAAADILCHPGAGIFNLAFPGSSP